LYNLNSILSTIIAYNRNIIEGRDGLGPVGQMDDGRGPLRVMIIRNLRIEGRLCEFYYLKKSFWE